MEGAAAGQLQDSAPIAGPTPKAERLASYANRPYRLRGRKYRPMTELTEYTEALIVNVSACVPDSPRHLHDSFLLLNNRHDSS